MSNTDKLLLAAQRAQQKAYAPYSHFPVGAALRTYAGTIYSGSNAENAAYPEGWCAETAAIAAMILGGEHQIDEVVIVSNAKRFTFPCGGCRQRMIEFSTADTQVRVVRQDGEQMCCLLTELLPHAFVGASLQ